VYDNILQFGKDNTLKVDYDNVLQVECDNMQGFGDFFFKCKQKSTDASMNVTVITTYLILDEIIFIFGYEMTLIFLTPLNLATYRQNSDKRKMASHSFGVV